MYKCNNCNKEYNTKSVLKKHQETTQKCLKLKKIIQKCSYCEYNTTNIDQYELHVHYCKIHTDKYNTLQIECEHLKTANSILLNNNENIQNKNKIIKGHNAKYKKDIHKLTLDNQLQLNTIKMLENQVSVSHQLLQDNIHTILSKPTIQQQENNLTNNNQKIDLSLNLNSDFIQKNVDDNFTLQHLVNGIKGVATFTNDFIIHKENGQSKYICADSSRSIFKYKDENGMIQKDIKANKLKNTVKNPIITKSKQLYEDESSRLLNSDESQGDILTINRINIGMLTDQFLKIKHIDDHVDEYAKEMILAIH